MDSSRRIRAKIAKRRCSALIARTSHRTTSSTASILSSTRRAGTRREAAQFAGEKRHNDALDRSIRFRDVARELAMSRRVHRFVILVVGARLLHHRRVDARRRALVTGVVDERDRVRSRARRAFRERYRRRERERGLERRARDRARTRRARDRARTGRRESLTNTTMGKILKKNIGPSGKTRIKTLFSPYKNGEKRDIKRRKKTSSRYIYLIR